MEGDDNDTNQPAGGSTSPRSRESVENESKESPPGRPPLPAEYRGQASPRPEGYTRNSPAHAARSSPGHWAKPPPPSPPPPYGLHSSYPPSPSSSVRSPVRSPVRPIVYGNPAYSGSGRSDAPSDEDLDNVPVDNLPDSPSKPGNDCDLEKHPKDGDTNRPMGSPMGGPMGMDLDGASNGSRASLRSPENVSIDPETIELSEISADVVTPIERTGYDSHGSLVSMIILKQDDPHEEAEENGEPASSAPLAVAEATPETDVPPEDTRCCGRRLGRRLGGPYGHMIDWYGRKRREGRLAYTIVFCILLVGCIIFLGLFPNSFIYVDHHEIALLRTKSTHTVDGQVYYPGCYVLGPDKDFLFFQGSAYNIDLDSMKVTTADRLQVKISLSLQYFIRPEQLIDLFHMFHRDFPRVFESLATSTIKNEVVKYNLDEFRLHRARIEMMLHKALAKRLGGDCCMACCQSSCTSHALCQDCSKKASCDRGYFVDVRFFQFGQLDIPDQVFSRFLKRTILYELADEAMLKQEYAVIQKVTQKKINEIHNQAHEIHANATAEETVIIAKAHAAADKTTTMAEMSGVRKMCEKLNIIDQEQKMSLFYIHSLRTMENLYKAPDYAARSRFEM